MKKEAGAWAPAGTGGRAGRRRVAATSRVAQRGRRRPGVSQLEEAAAGGGGGGRRWRAREISSRWRAEAAHSGGGGAEGGGGEEAAQKWQGRRPEARKMAGGGGGGFRQPDGAISAKENGLRCRGWGLRPRR